MVSTKFIPAELQRLLKKKEERHVMLRNTDNVVVSNKKGSCRVDVKKRDTLNSLAQMWGKKINKENSYI